MIYALVLIARLVMFFTSFGLFCAFEIAGKRTFEIDVFIFVTIRFGICLPLSKKARSLFQEAKERLDIHKDIPLFVEPKFEYNANPLAKIEEFFNTPAEKPIKEIYKPCLYPYSNMMITPAGDVYPCLSQKIGNVKDMPIKEVFNLPHYKCFRKNLKAAKVFGACQMCCELSVK